MLLGEKVPADAVVRQTYLGSRPFLLALRHALYWETELKKLWLAPKVLASPL